MCFAVVREDSVGVLEICGKFESLAAPGCHCLCCPIGIALVGQMSTRVRSVYVDVDTKTRDNVFVKLIVCAHIEILNDPAKRYLAFYKFHNPIIQIQSMVEDVVRGVVPTIDLDSIFAQKDTIALSLSERLSKDLENCGYKINASLILDIIPEDRVVRAMNTIECERRLRVAQLEKAEAIKYADIKRAEAKAEENYLQGWGLSKQRAAIVAGLREAVGEFSPNSSLNTSKVLQLMTITQYFDALEELGSGSNIYMLPKKHLETHKRATGNLPTAAIISRD